MLNQNSEAISAFTKLLKAQALARKDLQRELQQDDEVRGVKRKLQGEFLQIQEAASSADLQGASSASSKQRATNEKFFYAFDWSLMNTNGWSTSMFLPRRKCGSLQEGSTRTYVPQQCPVSGVMRKRAVITEPGKAPYFEVPMVVRNGIVCRPTMHMCFDMGSHSWPSMNWLINKVGIRGTLKRCLLHAHICTVADATSEAGLTVVRLEMHGFLKMRRAPWKQDQNHDILNHVAEELFTVLTEESILFEFYYEECCDALGDFSSDRGSPDHKRMVWLTYKGILCGMGLGDAPDRERWFAIEHLHWHQKQARPGVKMLLTYLGFRRNWWSTFESSPLFSSARKPLEEMENPNPEGLEACEDGAAAEPEDGHEVELDQPSSCRVSAAAAKKELQRRRQQCVGSFQFGARVIHRTTSVRLFDAMMCLELPLEVQFKKEMGRFHTVRGTKELMLCLSRGSWQGVVLEILQKFLSHEFASEAGFISAEPKTEHEINTDRLVARHSFRFCCHLAGATAANYIVHEVPPENFVLLASADNTVVQQGLTRLRSQFNALGVLETKALHNRNAHQYVAAQEWPLQQWTRENFSVLSETDFSSVYQWLKDDCSDYACGHNVTLLVENMWREAKKAMRTNARHRMEPKALWQVVANASPVAKEFDRPTVPVTNAAKAASLGHIPADIFYAEGKECSLDADVVDTLCGKADWPHHNSYYHRQAAFKTLAMEHHAGVWDDIEKTWLTLLVTPGTFLMHSDEKKMRLAIFVSADGFLGARCRMKKKGGRTYADFNVPDEIEPVKFCVVTNWKNGRCWGHALWCHQNRRNTVWAAHANFRARAMHPAYCSTVFVADWWHSVQSQCCVSLLLPSRYPWICAGMRNQSWIS